MQRTVTRWGRYIYVELPNTATEADVLSVLDEYRIRDETFRIMRSNIERTGTTYRTTDYTQIVAGGERGFNGFGYKESIAVSNYPLAEESIAWRREDDARREQRWAAIRAATRA